jgi:hypothetical protein
MPATKDATKRMTLKEWMDRGSALFGADMMQWKFVCPSCGNVQSPEDLRKYKDQGATPDTARFSCIGRYDGRNGTVPMCSGASPCNYTTGGLLNISPVCVTNVEGVECWSFDFADQASPSKE